MCVCGFFESVSISSQPIWIWAIGKAKNAGALPWTKVSRLLVHLSPWPRGSHSTSALSSASHPWRQPPPFTAQHHGTRKGKRLSLPWRWISCLYPVVLLTSSVTHSRCHKHSLPSFAIVYSCAHRLTLLLSGHVNNMAQWFLQLGSQNPWNSTEVPWGHRKVIHSWLF